MRTNTELWTYDQTLNANREAWVGYDVHATDGDIGTIDEMSTETGSAGIVVDTGFWIFGKKRLLPAACVRTVDHDGKRVHVSLSKEQIKNAPDYDAMRRGEPNYYNDYAGYFGPIL